MRHIIKDVYVLGVLVLIATGLVGLLMVVSQAVLLIALPDCPTEDSTNCYWDGGPNGEGIKFIDLNGWVIVTDEANQHYRG